MAEIITRKKKANFRIYLYDLENKKSRLISLFNHNKLTINQLKEKIINCIETTKK